METAKDSIINSPLIESLQALEAAVNGLKRLGIAIRHSSSTDLTQRTISFMEKIDDGSMESLFLLQLENQLVYQPERERKPRASLSLCKQLSISIAFRYFGVLYRRTHQQKLQTHRRQDRVQEASDNSGEYTSRMPEKRPISNTQKPLLPRMNQPMTDVSVSAPTTPNPSQVLRRYQSLGPSSASSTSTVSVHLKNVRYPDIPPADVSSCPFCAQPLNASITQDKKAWE